MYFCLAFKPTFLCKFNRAFLKYFQVSVTHLGGKPGGTIVITKPGTPPVTPSSTVGSAAGKNVVASSGAIAQLIQAAPASHGTFHSSYK